MENKAPQFLNVNESQLSSVQIGLAGKNLSQNQQIVKGELEKQGSTAEVLELIAQIETLLDGSNLAGRVLNLWKRVIINKCKS